MRGSMRFLLEENFLTVLCRPPGKALPCVKYDRFESTSNLFFTNLIDVYIYCTSMVLPLVYFNYINYFNFLKVLFHSFLTEPITVTILPIPATM